jgi:hypothetical protein
MKIFDEIERSFEGPASDRESHYGYLNRSGRKEFTRVRELMGEWFSRYPNDHKVELRSRLRSDIDRHFLSAFFELYLHEMLVRLGYSVEIHPNIPIESEKKPDFLVTNSKGEGYYLESIVSIDMSVAEVGARKRMDEVYDALNDIESPDFFIGINIRNMPSTPVPKKKMKREIKKFIKDLNPDKVLSYFNGGKDLPKKTFVHEEWNLEYYAIPKSPEARGKDNVRSLGVRMHLPAWIDTRTPIKNAILKKSTKYGVLGKPFIIAVNTLSIHVDNIDIMGALFGKESYIVQIDGSDDYEPKFMREPDGAWCGPKGPQNTRVSAVLIAPGIMPWTVAVRTPVVYHNPWAQFPCQGELAQLTRSIPNSECMETTSGLQGKDIFMLEEEWPSKFFCLSTGWS